MDDPVRLVERQRFKLSGSSYVIVVAAYDGGCVGGWECTQCGRGGRSAVKYSSRDEAEAWARQAATSHHAASHAEPDLARE